MYYKNKKTEKIYKLYEIKHSNMNIKELLCEFLREGKIELVVE